MRVGRCDCLVDAFESKDEAAGADVKVLLLVPVPVVEWFHLILVVGDVEEDRGFVHCLDLEDGSAMIWAYPASRSNAVALVEGVVRGGDGAFDVERHGGLAGE